MIWAINLAWGEDKAIIIMIIANYAIGIKYLYVEAGNMAETIIEISFDNTPT